MILILTYDRVYKTNDVYALSMSNDATISSANAFLYGKHGSLPTKTIFHVTTKITITIYLNLG